MWSMLLWPLCIFKVRVTALSFCDLYYSSVMLVLSFGFVFCVCPSFYSPSLSALGCLFCKRILSVASRNNAAQNSHPLNPCHYTVLTLYFIFRVRAQWKPFSVTLLLPHSGWLRSGDEPIFFKTEIWCTAVIGYRWSMQCFNSLSQAIDFWMFQSQLSEAFFYVLRAFRGLFMCVHNFFFQCFLFLGFPILLHVCY